MAEDLDGYGAETLVAPTDVTDEAQVDRAVERTVDRFGGLDVVVANAATARNDPIEEMSTERYHTVVSVNIDGTFFTTRAILPDLRDSAGTLVFVGSFAGQYPHPKDPLYASTKWWLRGFAHSVAGNVGPEGVGVTVVSPGETRTEFRSADTAPAHERFAEGTAAEPEDVAEAIAFAARQRPPNAVQSLEFYRLDKFGHF